MKLSRKRLSKIKRMKNQSRKNGAARKRGGRKRKRIRRSFRRNKLNLRTKTLRRKRYRGRRKAGGVHHLRRVVRKLGHKKKQTPAEEAERRRQKLSQSNKKAQEAYEKIRVATERARARIVELKSASTKMNHEVGVEKEKLQAAKVQERLKKANKKKAKGADAASAAAGARLATRRVAEATKTWKLKRRQVRQMKKRIGQAEGRWRNLDRQRAGLYAAAAKTLGAKHDAAELLDQRAAAAGGAEQAHTVQFFADLLRQNANISLDKAILLFERPDSKPYKTLSKFAERLHGTATAQSYRRKYGPAFLQAGREVAASLRRGRRRPSPEPQPSPGAAAALYFHRGTRAQGTQRSAAEEAAATGSSAQSPASTPSSAERGMRWARHTLERRHYQAAALERSAQEALDRARAHHAAPSALAQLEQEHVQAHQRTVKAAADLALARRESGTEEKAQEGPRGAATLSERLRHKELDEEKEEGGGGSTEGSVSSLGDLGSQSSLSSISSDWVSTLGDEQQRHAAEAAAAVRTGTAAVAEERENLRRARLREQQLRARPTSAASRVTSSDLAALHSDSDETGQSAIAPRPATPPHLWPHVGRLERGRSLVAPPPGLARGAALPGLTRGAAPPGLARGTSPLSTRMPSQQSVVGPPGGKGEEPGGRRRARALFGPSRGAKKTTSKTKPAKKKKKAKVKKVTRWGVGDGGKWARLGADAPSAAAAAASEPPAQRSREVKSDEGEEVAAYRRALQPWRPPPSADQQRGRKSDRELRLVMDAEDRRAGHAEWRRWRAAAAAGAKASAQEGAEEGQARSAGSGVSAAAAAAAQAAAKGAREKARIDRLQGAVGRIQAAERGRRGRQRAKAARQKRDAADEQEDANRARLSALVGEARAKAASHARGLGDSKDLRRHFQRQLGHQDHLGARATAIEDVRRRRGREGYDPTQSLRAPAAAATRDAHIRIMKPGETYADAAAAAGRAPGAVVFPPAPGVTRKRRQKRPGLGAKLKYAVRKKSKGTRKRPRKQTRPGRAGSIEMTPMGAAAVPPKAPSGPRGPLGRRVRRVQPTPQGAAGVTPSPPSGPRGPLGRRVRRVQPTPQGAAGVTPSPPSGPRGPLGRRVRRVQPTPQGAAGVTPSPPSGPRGPLGRRVRRVQPRPSSRIGPRPPSAPPSGVGAQGRLERPVRIRTPSGPPSPPPSGPPGVGLTDPERAAIVGKTPTIIYIYIDANGQIRALYNPAGMAPHSSVGALAAAARPSAHSSSAAGAPGSAPTGVEAAAPVEGVVVTAAGDVGASGASGPSSASVGSASHVATPDLWTSMAHGGNHPTIVPALGGAGPY